MNIAREILDSRKEKTIEININGIKASSPSGKSKGKYEAKSYKKNLSDDIKVINKLSGDIVKIKIEEFKDLEKLEKLIKNKIGANSLFALESCLLKLAGKRDGKELFEFLGKQKKMPFLLGNCIGGGLHSKGIEGKKPDFQEFLFIPETKISLGIEVNERCYWGAFKILSNLKKVIGRNDEGAWNTSLDNEQVLEVMNDVRENVSDELGVKIKLGVDAASSNFYNKTYSYKNKEQKLKKEEQIEFIDKIIHKHNIFYVEDALEENDFRGFSKLNKKKIGMIAGDDLTVTNLERLKKAIKLKSISGIIIKPNQNGSLIDTKKVLDLARKNDIKTIISHRSGETMDVTIADLAVAWNSDYIKTGIYGDVRKAKLERLREIEARAT